MPNDHKEVAFGLALPVCIGYLGFAYSSRECRCIVVGESIGIEVLDVHIFF